MQKKVLLVGESWFTYSVHQKGFDAFYTSEYVEGAGEFIAALRALGYVVDYLPSHEVSARMPSTVDALREYGTVILSDVGSNTFLLGEATFKRSETAVNLLEVLAAYVHGGGSLLMVGGYMSFSGIDGKARFGSSPLAPVLPVRMLDIDDRVEVPQGVTPEVVEPRHVALAKINGAWPHVLGYNRVLPKEDAEVLLTCGDDPLLVVGTYGAGRTAAFTTDLAPHWAPPAFVSWDGYPLLWDGLLSWLAAC